MEVPVASKMLAGFRNSGSSCQSQEHFERTDGIPAASRQSELPTEAQLEVLNAITKNHILCTYSTPEGVGKARIETAKGKVVKTIRRLIADACLRREWLEQVSHADSTVHFKLSAAGVAAKSSGKKASKATEPVPAKKARATTKAK